mgnify:CR=1 FL=1
MVDMLVSIFLQNYTFVQICAINGCEKYVNWRKFLLFMYFLSQNSNFLTEKFVDKKNCCTFAHELRMHRGVEQW